MTTLAGVLPETQAGYDALDQYARSIGVSIGVANFGGLRTQSDTTKILGYRQNDYAAALQTGSIRPDTTLQQFRPIAAFGSSYHNYGAAFDVDIVARPASMSVAQALATLGTYAPSIGLRWGGRFTNPDPPHFELAIALPDAQARYRAALSNTPPSVFDFSSFLPGLGPTSDDLEAAMTAPDAYAADDESGEAALDNLPSDDNTAPLIALGLFVAGVVAWAIRRKFKL